LRIANSVTVFAIAHSIPARIAHAMSAASPAARPRQTQHL
jgi:hypothetical protein